MLGILSARQTFLDFVIGVVTINDTGSLTIANIEARHLCSVPGLVIPNGGNFSTTNIQVVHHSISRRDQCGVITSMIELSCGKFLNVTIKTILTRVYNIGKLQKLQCRL